MSSPLENQFEADHLAAVIAKLPEGAIPVTTAGGGGSTATATKQDEQTAVLENILAGVSAVGVHRYPNSTVYEAVRDFTGVTKGDEIQNITIIDTSNNSVSADVWINKSTGLTLSTAPGIGTDVTYTAGTALTNAELRLTPVTVQGDISGVAIPISANTLPLPTGASTAGNQVTGNSSLSSIDNKLPTLGQKTSSASLPIVLASDSLDFGTGTVGSKTQRVTLASDGIFALATGTTSDSQATNATSSWSVISLLKGLFTNTKVTFGSGTSDATTQRIVPATDSTFPVQVTTRTCVGRQTISVTTGAVSTLTVPTGAVAAMIQADGNSVSITIDGTTPTATIGSRIDDGVFYYVDTALANVKLIARSATTNVQVVYFDKA